MNTSEETSLLNSAETDEECRQVRMNLPLEMLGVLDEDSSSVLFQHLSHCRCCLEAHIALQAAAELACPVR